MKKLLALIVLACLLSACEKRYEDGPCLSFIKAENRLCGEWNIAEATVQNTLVEGASADTLATYGFSFFMNSSKAYFLSLSDSSGITIAESLVRTNDRLTNLSFSLSPITGYEEAIAPLLRIFPALEPDQTWEISRLRREELWIHTTWQDANHELKFKLLNDFQSL